MLGVHWWSGLKLVLAALGVIALGTAIKTFMSWSPKTAGGNAFFTIGVAIVGALLLGKVLPKGGAAALTTAGLVIGGYEWLKPQADQLGASVGSSIRGGGFMGGATVNYGTVSPTGVGVGAAPGSVLAPTVIQPTPLTTAPSITVIQQAAKAPGLAQQVVGGVLGAAQSFFGAGGGFGSLVGGSKGVQDLNYNLGSGAVDARYARLLNLTAV